MIVENQVFQVKVNNKNIKWYKSKGFECNLKDIINVPLEYLIPGCHIRIKYICDGCGEEKDVGYCDYITKKSNKDYCKKCASKNKPSNEFYLEKDGFKVCNKCERKLPANIDYYHKKHDTKDGFTNNCKECRGYKFTNKLTHIPQEGYKFCIKCDRELPIDIKYFPPDKLCLDGLRNVCRECGKDGHFMEDGYIPKKWWTKEEEEFLISVYPNYTCEELVKKYYPNMTPKQLWDKAWLLGISFKNDEVIKRGYEQRSIKISGENHYAYGKPMPEKTRKKLSIAKKGKYIGKDNWWYGKKQSLEHRNKLSIARKELGRWKGDKNPRHINPLNGELNGRWEGGIKELYYDLRDHLQGWKKSSIEECHYKCVLTGGEFDNIHHLYNFKNIVREVFSELQLPMYQTIGEYSEFERENIYKLLNEKHKFYGNGVCLCKPLHKLFHDTYGYFNNTKKQFELFTERYKNFEFDILLNKKYKYANVLLKEVDI